MKLNNWSVVKSPNGISLRHISHASLEPEDPEICVAKIDNRMRITVHIDGIDEPVHVFEFSTRDFRYY